MRQHPPTVGVSRRITVKSYGVGLIPFKCQALEGALWRFTNDSVAEPWLTAQRRPNRIICPKCESDSAAEPDDHKPLPFRCCRPCLAQFSFKSQIALIASQLRLCVWAKASHAARLSYRRGLRFKYSAKGVCFRARRMRSL